MLAFVLHPLRQLWRVCTCHDAPRQVAAGVAIGAVIGLVPLANLTAVALCLLLCGVKANKAAGLLAAVIFTWVTTVTDPFAHRLGMTVLSIGELQGFYAMLYELPLVPWFDLQNTVVVGSLLLGVYLAYPVYWISYLVAARLESWRSDVSRRRYAAELAGGMNLGAKWGTAA